MASDVRRLLHACQRWLRGTAPLFSGTAKEHRRCKHRHRRGPWLPAGSNCRREQNRSDATRERNRQPCTRAAGGRVTPECPKQLKGIKMSSSILATPKATPGFDV